MFDISPSNVTEQYTYDVVVVTRTVVQVWEASISRLLAESELCRKSLPVELLVHFTLHIDVAAQEIRSGDNLCIRGPDTISVHGGAVRVIRDIFLRLSSSFDPYAEQLSLITRWFFSTPVSIKSDCPEVTVAVSPDFVNAPWLSEFLRRGEVNSCLLLLLRVKAQTCLNFQSSRTVARFSLSLWSIDRIEPLSWCILALARWLLFSAVSTACWGG